MNHCSFGVCHDVLKSIFDQLIDLFWLKRSFYIETEAKNLKSSKSSEIEMQSLLKQAFHFKDCFNFSEQMLIGLKGFNPKDLTNLR